MEDIGLGTGIWHLLQLCAKDEPGETGGGKPSQRMVKQEGCEFPLDMVTESCEQVKDQLQGLELGGAFPPVLSPHLTSVSGFSCISHSFSSQLEL